MFFLKANNSNIRIVHSEFISKFTKTVIGKSMSKKIPNAKAKSSDQTWGQKGITFPRITHWRTYTQQWTRVQTQYGESARSKVFTCGRNNWYHCPHENSYINHLASTFNCDDDGIICSIKIEVKTGSGIWCHWSNIHLCDQWFS